VVQNGYIEIYDSFISKNYAHNNPVAQLFDSSFVSVISNTQIHGNEYLSKAEIDTELNNT